MSASITRDQILAAQKAWGEGPFKYLLDPLYQTEALYDFVADPAESVDVKDQHPEVVARAREARA